jgi:hypothetical protein
MDDPDFIRQPDSVDDPKGVTPKCQRDLKDAGAEAKQGLCNVCLAALGRDRQPS